MKADPRSIARSLKRSADRSRRRKSNPFGSAMSMLSFYINRAGHKLSKTRRARLEAAKEETARDEWAATGSLGTANHISVLVILSAVRRFPYRRLDKHDQ